jgi:hypothetical protein
MGAAERVEERERERGWGREGGETARRGPFCC